MAYSNKVLYFCRHVTSSNCCYTAWPCCPQGAGAPASLAELSDERALALYEEAFEAVAASLPSEQGATQVLNQSIRVSPGLRAARTPEQSSWLDALVMQVGSWHIFKWHVYPVLFV
jgi:hypothetical protein